jgi:hypothetical protein
MRIEIMRGGSFFSTVPAPTASARRTRRQRGAGRHVAEAGEAKIEHGHTRHCDDATYARRAAARLQGAPGRSRGGGGGRRCHVDCVERAHPLL